MDQPLRRLSPTARMSGRMGLCAALVLVASLCVGAEEWNAGQASASPEVSSLPPARRPAPPKASTPPAVRAESKPSWTELTPLQQQTLAPLGASWKSLTEAHKRKWIALSDNYPRMAPEEQAKLRGRMTEWAALSPQQRTQARLNFAETKKLAPGDKKAAWEAYQALPPEEKRRLAAGAAVTKPAPPPTAAAVKPVPPQKLAHVPKAQQGDTRAPRIAAVPGPLPETGSNAPLPADAATKR